VNPFSGTFSEFYEVLDGNGRVGFKEPNGDFAFSGVEDGVCSSCE
jgi:hypothetical protein